MYYDSFYIFKLIVFVLIKINYWISVFFIVFFFFKNLSLSLICTTTIDNFFRLNYNDSLLNYYSFYWTNFWYIPLFFFVLTKINIFFLHNYLWIYWIIFYVYEIFDLSLTNWSYFTLTTTQMSLNTLLTNNLNKIHPFIFYESSSIFICLYILIQSFIFKKHFWSTTTILVNLNFFRSFVFLICLFSLFLGSWWALQEGTWGGWWAWDASEVFGFFLLLIYFRIMHLKLTKFCIWSFYIFLTLNIKYLTILYSLMQLNFDLVSHNFGIKFFFFFNNSLFFIEFLLVVIFVLILNYKLFSNNRSNTIIFFRKKFIKIFLFKKFYFTLFFWSFLVLIFFGSFGPICSYFFWFYFSLNFLNEFGVHQLNNLSAICFVVFLSWFYKNTSNRYFFFSVFYNTYNIELFSLKTKWNFFFRSHFFFLTIFFITHQSLYSQFSRVYEGSIFLPYLTKEFSESLYFSIFSFAGSSIISTFNTINVSYYSFINFEDLNSFVFLPIFGFLLSIFNFYYFLNVNTETFIYLTSFELSFFSNFLLFFFFFIFYNFYVFFWKLFFWKF